MERVREKGESLVGVSVGDGRVWIGGAVGVAADGGFGVVDQGVFEREMCDGHVLGVDEIGDDVVNPTGSISECSLLGVTEDIPWRASPT